jgi:hypothetical protein
MRNFNNQNNNVANFDKNSNNNYNHRNELNANPRNYDQHSNNYIMNRNFEHNNRERNDNNKNNVDPINIPLTYSSSNNSNISNPMPLNLKNSNQFSQNSMDKNEICDNENKIKYMKNKKTNKLDYLNFIQEKRKCQNNYQMNRLIGVNTCNSATNLEIPIEFKEKAEKESSFPLNSLHSYISNIFI